MNTDPAGYAKKYGRLTGRCCFCRIQLTNETSLSVGYGLCEICAGNYGLPYYYAAK